jgi:hypothetical protein
MLKDNPITMLIWGHQVDLIDPNLSIVVDFVLLLKKSTLADFFIRRNS